MIVGVWIKRGRGEEGGTHSMKSYFSSDARSILALLLQKRKDGECSRIANFECYPTSIMNEKSSNSNLWMGASSFAAMEHLKYILCVNDRLGLGFVVYSSRGTPRACKISGAVEEEEHQECRLRMGYLTMGPCLGAPVNTRLHS